MLGAYGNKLIKTPNIDAIAQQGTIFDKAYVTTSICPSSRASIFTGQYVSRHGVGAPHFGTDISETAITNSYPALLRKAGYTTGFVGKYGIGTKLPVGRFDYTKAFTGQGRYFSGNPLQHITSIIGQDAQSFLNAQTGKTPFCLSVSFKAPHANPPEYLADPKDIALYQDVTIPTDDERYECCFDTFPDFFKNVNEGRKRWQERFVKPGVQNVLRNYYALITGVDRVIGDMIDSLTAIGQLNNTVIIMTSDNGFFLGEYGLAGKWFGYEPSIRVPMIITDFRQTSGSQRSQKLALNIDIAPTLLSLAKLPIPSRMQGQSLEPVLQGSARLNGWRKSFYYEHLFENPNIPKSQGIVGEQYKYMRYWEGENTFETLFDLDADPLELTNLATDTSRQNQLIDLRQHVELEAKKAL